MEELRPKKLEGEQPELQIVPAVPEKNTEKNKPEISPQQLDELIKSLDDEDDEEGEENKLPTLH